MMMGDALLYVKRLQKKLFCKFARFTYDEKAENRKFNTLVNQGVVKFTNAIDPELLIKWTSQYNLYQSEFFPAGGNITFPFYNKEMHELLKDSEFIHVVKQYFNKIYRKEAVLQIVPHIVVTYPTITHDEFNVTKNHFPASWHVDYPYEFTVHIPLTPISEETSRTEYINGTHLTAGRTANNRVLVDNNEVTGCLAKPGDVLCLDVEGLHRARLVENSFRVLVQIKVTAGNDLLKYNKSSKMDSTIGRSIHNCKNYNLLKNKLIDDLNFIESLDYIDNSLDILKNNVAYYEHYINLQ